MHDDWCKYFDGKLTISDMARIYEEKGVGNGF